MSNTAAKSDSFLSNFRPLEQELARRGPDWMRELRRKGRQRFDELGLPTTRHEEWRNTSVAPIVRTRFLPAAAAGSTPAPSELPRLARMELGGPRLTFLDGRYTPELSGAGQLPDGVWVGNLAAALEQIPQRLEPLLSGKDDAGAFQALNGALLEDGAVVWIPDGLTLEAPVQLVYLAGSSSEPIAVHPRTLVVAGASSRATVVETYSGFTEQVYLTNAVTELFVGENGSLDHYRIQHESELAYHVSSVVSRQQRNARCNAYNINLGGRLVRHNIRAVLDGEGGDCNLYGLNLTRGRQHVDNHTVLVHARPHCTSRELYKGILDGKSRSVFSGRIIVRKGAQKTDAKQSNPNLLLSGEALAHTRPQLEIYADDVRCTHGATIGRMSEDAIFYLRSRGIAESEARNMLIEAFAGEVLELVGIDDLRIELEREVASRLPGAADGTRE